MSAKVSATTTIPRPREINGRRAAANYARDTRPPSRLTPPTAIFVRRRRWCPVPLGSFLLLLLSFSPFYRHNRPAACVTRTRIRMRVGTEFSYGRVDEWRGAREVDSHTPRVHVGRSAHCGKRTGINAPEICQLSAAAAAAAAWSDVYTVPRAVAATALRECCRLRRRRCCCRCISTRGEGERASDEDDDGDGWGGREEEGFFGEKYRVSLAPPSEADGCCARPPGERVESTLIKVSRVSGY